MNDPTVTIPRQEYEDLVRTKASFQEVRDVIRSAFASPAGTADGERVPVEDARLYKPSFLRGVREAAREAASGKGIRVRSLMDL